MSSGRSGASRDSGASSSGSGGAGNKLLVGLGAVALGAVAAVGGYLIGKSNAEEEAEIAELRQRHQRGFIPSSPPKKPTTRSVSSAAAAATAVPGAGATSNSCKDQDGAQECAICLRTFQELSKLEEEIHTTPCGHVFCYTCISQTLPSRAKCPICNNPVKPGQTMRLYL